MRSHTTKNNRSTRWGAVLGMLGLLFSSSAFAQDVSAVREIERDADSLRDRIEQPPRPDVDVADSAIVLTNAGGLVRPAFCVAFDYGGERLGRARVRIPAHGLRWLLASDLSQDVDFIGSAHCYVGAGVVGSAIFLGPGITDLPVHQARPTGPRRILIPVVAHY